MRCRKRQRSTNLSRFGKGIHPSDDKILFCLKHLKKYTVRCLQAHESTTNSTMYLQSQSTVLFTKPVLCIFSKRDHLPSVDEFLTTRNSDIKFKLFTVENSCLLIVSRDVMFPQHPNSLSDNLSSQRIFSPCIFN